jgi:hypothetical protein
MKTLIQRNLFIKIVVPLIPSLFLSHVALAQSFACYIPGQSCGASTISGSGTIQADAGYDIQIDGAYAGNSSMTWNTTTVSPGVHSLQECENQTVDNPDCEEVWVPDEVWVDDWVCDDYDSDGNCDDSVDDGYYEDDGSYQNQCTDDYTTTYNCSDLFYVTVAAPAPATTPAPPPSAGTGGGVVYWAMNGINYASGGFLPNAAGGLASWRLVASADLNGDGHPDLIWQNVSDGSVVYWLMNGMNYVSGGSLPGAGPTAGLANWRLVTAADLNGDGHPDLIWQSDVDGSVVYWLMNGLSYVSGGTLPGSATGLESWRLVTTADLNGDGHPDLIWQSNVDGSVVYWLMNGLNYVSGASLPNAGPSAGLMPWRLVTAADLNGDGHPDFLWQSDDDGSVVYWLMNGLNYVSGASLPGAGPSAGLSGWTLITLTNFTSGQSDLLWQQKE